MSERQNQNSGGSGLKEEMIEFVVYGDPIPKGRPRVVNGHAFTPTRTKKYEEQIALVYKSQYRDFKFCGCALGMDLDIYVKISKSDRKAVKEAKRKGEIRPVERTGDLDNIAKAIQDALNGVAYEDDSQIVELSCKKYYSDEPRVLVRIERIA